MAKPEPTTPEVAADAGFPVTVQVAYPDGPLRLYDPATGSEQNYTVERGRVSATTHDRLASLVAIGGTPLAAPTA